MVKHRLLITLDENVDLTPNEWLEFYKAIEQVFDAIKEHAELKLDQFGMKDDVRLRTLHLYHTDKVITEDAELYNQEDRSNY